MARDNLRYLAEQLHEYLRRRISGCPACETAHDPRGHDAPILPQLSNMGQELTWICENGHRHYLDILMAATSIRLDGNEISIFDAHMGRFLIIRVVPAEQTRVESGPDGIPTFTIRARDAGPDRLWFEHIGGAKEKREALQDFAEAVIAAQANPQAEANPELRCIYAAIIVAGDHFSWGCEGAEILRRLQVKTLEEQAQDWEDNNLRLQVGEAVIQAAVRSRRGPGQVILKVDGGQINILVNVLSGGNRPTPEGAAVVDAEELVRMAQNRVIQGQDAEGMD